MMRRIRTAGILFAIGLTAACAGDDPGASPANMALACQTTPCICVSETKSLLRKDKTADVLWKTNGDAYCAKGFALEKAAKP